MKIAKRKYCFRISALIVSIINQLFKLIIEFRIRYFPKIKQTINNHEYSGLYVIYLWMSLD